MELFSLLEQRIDSLIFRVKELTAHNSQLEANQEILEMRNKELIEQITHLNDEVLVLATELTALKEKALQERIQLEDELSQKALTKLIVEDLVKNIEASVSQEKCS
jgi:succinylarginine dihydrolase